MLNIIKKGLKDTQEYLRSGRTLEDFKVSHGIRGKTDLDKKHLVLDYDQLSVKWTESYGWVCRGLILDAKTFDLIGMGLPKFHNFGEHYAAPIDWLSAKTFEKVDGSCVMRWFSPHTKNFEYSTRFQLPENIKVNTVNSGVITWEQLINKCLEGWKEILPLQPKDETWVFEICSLHNQIVVRHQGFYAKILAARNIHTLEELSHEKLPGHPEMKPKSYSFNSPKEVADFANTFEATKNEGFVVCDTGFNRIKIKSDQYVALHRAKDGLKGINNLISLARGNDYEEITVHFPEYKPDLDTVSALIEEMIVRHEAAYETTKSIESQKDFAVEIQKLGLENTSSLFLTRAKKQPSVRTAFLVLEDTPFIKLFKERARAKLGDKYAEEIKEGV